MHQKAGELRSQRPAPSKASGVEAQPNNTAPLLRDERARRDWVEHELDFCCQVRHPLLTCKHVPLCGCVTRKGRKRLVVGRHLILKRFSGH